MFKKIAIIGVGLIGGSIGLAVKNKKLAREVIGIGRRKSSLQNALERKAVDRVTLDIEKGVKGCDLIVVAASIENVLPKIKEAAAFAKKRAIIIDVNSTKEKVAAFADEIMPKGVSFVGTHPLAGLEKSGVLYADVRLFENTVCIITPTSRTDKQALRKITRFWKSLGARAMIMSPHEHDRLAATVSHLPHILAYNLCYTVSTKDIRNAGSGFKDTTRIAKSDPMMWTEIFFQNKTNLLNAIAIFERNLKNLTADLKAKKMDAVFKKLSSAKTKRESIG